MVKILKNNKKRVLLVEDDKMLSRALGDLLKDEGFSVGIIQDGLMAFPAAKKTKPGIILLDIVLPGMDGFGVLRQLKADLETKKIPVLMISNLDKVADVKSAKVLGADGYILKATASMDDILKQVKKHIK